MEYQKIINILDDTKNQSSTFRNWVEINYELKGRYDKSNIRFETSLIRSNVCDYSDAYILVKRIIIAPSMAAASAAVNNTNKKVIFTDCTLVTYCITEINNSQVDDAQKLM